MKTSVCLEQDHIFKTRLCSVLISIKILLLVSVVYFLFCFFGGHATARMILPLTNISEVNITVVNMKEMPKLRHVTEISISYSNILWLIKSI
jgi:hypothetical protein